MRKVILDVDTGSDDSVAIMAALLSKDLKVEAICSTWGNLDLEHTTENTLRLVEAMGRGSEVPIYKGCRGPMVKNLCGDRLPAPVRKLYKDGVEVHMHDPELDLPKATIKPQELPAPLFYVDYLMNAREKVTLIPVGPLTSLGHAFRIRPEIVKNIEEIVIMGGGDRVANDTPCAEFNIWADPEAAQIVIDSGAKITWVPLDATHAAYLTKKDCEKFRKIGTFEAKFAADLIDHRILAHTLGQPLAEPDAAAVHDPLCVCYCIDPTVLTDVRDVNIRLGFYGIGEGETIVDRREKPDKPNCRFAFGADRKKFCDILCRLFTY
ncbi:MAG: nucleoside hydrolase [Oscillospiraceae bacterium]